MGGLASGVLAPDREGGLNHSERTHDLVLITRTPLPSPHLVLSKDRLYCRAAPTAGMSRQKTRTSQCPGRIRFEGIKYWLWFAQRGNNCMNMIAPHIDRAQTVVA